jgi:hypothetical protein
MRMKACIINSKKLLIAAIVLMNSYVYAQSPFHCTVITPEMVHDNCGSANLDLESSTLVPHDIPGWMFFSAINEGGTLKDYIRTMSPGAGKISVLKSTFPFKDPFGNFDVFNPVVGNTVVQLGNSINGAEYDQMTNVFKVNRDNPYINVKYAVVMENPGHASISQPYFSMAIYKYNASGSPLCSRIECASYRVVSGENIPGFEKGKFDVLYKPWTIRTFDMSKFFSSGVNEETFVLEFTTADCAAKGHFAYAYVDAGCDAGISHFAQKYCYGEAVSFYGPLGNFKDEDFYWDFGDGEFSLEKYPIHYFDEAKTYTVKLNINSAQGASPCYPIEIAYDVDIHNCCDPEDAPEKIACVDCIPAFAPTSTQKYIVSAWVKEDVANLDTDPRSTDYKVASPHIVVSFPGTSTTVSCFPSGPIIDGWQRIEQEFMIPNCSTSTGITGINIQLNNVNLLTNNVYYDDIRFFPKDGSMKSFVYDPVSQKMVAELDENNFATLYEYDEEGALVRVKKETERGIKTIKVSGKNTQR